MKDYRLHINFNYLAYFHVVMADTQTFSFDYLEREDIRFYNLNKIFHLKKNNKTIYYKIKPQK